MKFAAVVVAMWLAAPSGSAHAQPPHIVGAWKLDVAASQLPPGPPPQTHVRRYSLADDGETLIGLAVIVSAQGDPTFLQFAAKPDGKHYAEFNSRILVQLQIDGTKPTVNEPFTGCRRACGILDLRALRGHHGRPPAAAD